MQSNLDISKFSGLFLQVMINYFALRVIRTCKESHEKDGSIWENIFDRERIFDSSKISHELDIEFRMYIL